VHAYEQVHVGWSDLKSLARTITSGIRKDYVATEFFRVEGGLDFDRNEFLFGALMIAIRGVVYHAARPLIG